MLPQGYSLGQAISVSLNSSTRQLTSHNVLALLEGTTRKVRIAAAAIPKSTNCLTKISLRYKQDEVIVYSGHWDHFGKRVDGIYHGARDNALSVAALLELAKGFAAVPKVQLDWR